jgi:hypothetical protein
MDEITNKTQNKTNPKQTRCKYHSKNDNLMQAISFTQCFVFGEFSPILQNILKKYILSQILLF